MLIHFIRIVLVATVCSFFTCMQDAAAIPFKQARNFLQKYPNIRFFLSGDENSKVINDLAKHVLKDIWQVNSRVIDGVDPVKGRYRNLVMRHGKQMFSIFDLDENKVVAAKHFTTAKQVQLLTVPRQHIELPTVNIEQLPYQKFLAQEIIAKGNKIEAGMQGWLQEFKQIEPNEWKDFETFIDGLAEVFTANNISVEKIKDNFYHSRSIIINGEIEALLRARGMTEKESEILLKHLHSDASTRASLQKTLSAIKSIGTNDGIITIKKFNNMSDKIINEMKVESFFKQVQDTLASNNHKESELAKLLLQTEETAQDIDYILQKHGGLSPHDLDIRLFPETISATNLEEKYSSLQDLLQTHYQEKYLSRFLGLKKLYVETKEIKERIIHLRAERVKINKTKNNTYIDDLISLGEKFGNHVIILSKDKEELAKDFAKLTQIADSINAVEAKLASKLGSDFAKYFSTLRSNIIHFRKIHAKPPNNIPFQYNRSTAIELDEWLKSIDETTKELEKLITKVIAEVPQR